MIAGRLRPSTMQSLHYLIDYGWARQAVALGVVIATLCSLLSVIIVLKRLSFAGHGVPHAAFAGVGLAVFLGLSPLWHNLVVFAVCLGCALSIGALAHRRRVEHDSAVGIVLVIGMAIGLLLDNLSVKLRQYDWYADFIGPMSYRPGFENVLFGSVLDTTPERLYVALAVCVVVLLVAWALYKEIVFYTFDEGVSRVFGVPANAIHYLIMTLLAVTIVLGLRLVGVLLLTALLVIPGATALLLSDRLSRVLLLSWLVGVTGTVGGLLVSFELDLYTGPCIAAALGAIFGAVYLARSLIARRT